MMWCLPQLHKSNPFLDHFFKINLTFVSSIFSSLCEILEFFASKPSLHDPHISNDCGR